MRVLRWTALVALCLSGTLFAQGRSGSSTNDTLSNMNAYRELRMFGICVARSQRADALAVIAARHGSPEEVDLIRRRILGERETCMGAGDTTRMTTTLARGALAEGLLLSGGVPPELRLPAPRPEEVRDLAGAGRCYASGHQTEARAVLAAQIASPQETAAIRGIWNDFRTCLSRFQVRLNAVWIRYLLAEGLLMLAPAGPGSGN